MQPDSDDLILPLDAFIRSVAVKTAVPHSFFLGAGFPVTFWSPFGLGMYLGVEARDLPDEKPRTGGAILRASPER